jgi:MFS transporter, putative metabolite:H+ symporter
MNELNKSASKEKTILQHLMQPVVIVAALGYFVDIYDLLLFTIVRIPSLKSLGFSGEDLQIQGGYLISVQMWGLLVGGILWGILGDKKGRVSVLFGSILIYSLANIANAFVQNIEQYAIVRFIAGVGLAGELGAGITLVVEILPKEIRGYGTSLVAALGLLGAVLANIIADYFEWKIAYIIGGCLGLCLLLLRVGLFESGLFAATKTKKVERGNFLYLFSTGKRFLKYIQCILIGLSTWFMIGILVTFSPEFGKYFGVDGVQAGKSVMYCYIGLSIGDLSSGLLSQWLKSRRKALLIFMIVALGSILLYLFGPHSIDSIYLYCFIMGLGFGYWALFITVGAEQFGTNLRSTVATTVPNFIRGTVPLLIYLFRAGQTSLGIIPSALMLAFGTFIIAILALWGMEETFGKDLDFEE